MTRLTSPTQTEKPMLTSYTRFQQEFATGLASAIEAAYSESIDDASLYSDTHVAALIERPRKAQFGDLAFPLFPYVKLVKEAPPVVFEKIFAKLYLPDDLGEVTFAGGYLNLTLNTTRLAKALAAEILPAPDQFGSSSFGAGKRMLVEFSSPNIAKPFGIGHLRTTVIGASLNRIFAFLGYETVSINYLGDWGTQFGKMIVAYQKWDGEKELAENAIKGALSLYVRFHEEEKNDPTLSEAARLAFKKLEDGDPEMTELWEMFKTVSWKEFERVYNVLGIKFDLITGESFFNDKMDEAISRLEKAGLTSESRGAEVVDLGEFNLPPCLLRKQDGATLYATRDIAGLMYRWDTYRFCESLYIVGSAQADHFKQVFKVLELLEDAEGAAPDERMTGKVKHIPFGWVKFEDQALKTRAGHVIYLDDVLQKAISLAESKIRDKNAELADLSNVAKQIGVGAIVFSQLSVRRQKDVNFTWEGALNYEGETGPYLQYTHARLSSLLRRYHSQSDEQSVPNYNELDYTVINDTNTHQLMATIARFPATVENAAKEYEPFLISSYLLELTALFNSFYQRRDENGKIVKILSDNKALTDSLMSIVIMTRATIATGLHLLGLEAPEEM